MARTKRTARKTTGGRAPPRRGVKVPSYRDATGVEFKAKILKEAVTKTIDVLHLYAPNISEVRRFTDDIKQEEIQLIDTENGQIFILGKNYERIIFHRSEDITYAVEQEEVETDEVKVIGLRIIESNEDLGFEEITLSNIDSYNNDELGFMLKLFYKNYGLHTVDSIEKAQWLKRIIEEFGREFGGESNFITRKDKELIFEI